MNYYIRTTQMCNPKVPLTQHLGKKHIKKQAVVTALRLVKLITRSDWDLLHSEYQDMNLLPTSEL